MDGTIALMIGYVLGSVMTWVLFVRPAMDRIRAYQLMHSTEMVPMPSPDKQAPGEG